MGTFFEDGASYLWRVDNCEKREEKSFAIAFCMQYYKVEIPRVGKGLLCAMHAVVSVLVLTCDHHTLFYSHIDYVEEGFFPHLVLGHGIIYILYTACIILYLLIVLLIGIKKYGHTNAARERRQIGFMVLIPGTSAIGLLIFFSGVAKGYDTTLPAYLICAIMLLVLLLLWRKNQRGINSGFLPLNMVEYRKPQLLSSSSAISKPNPISSFLWASLPTVMISPPISL